MKKILFVCLALMLAAGLMAGCGGQKAANDAPKKIVIGLDDNFPPMGFLDEKNEITGFDVELAKEARGRRFRVVASTRCGMAWKSRRSARRICSFPSRT